MDEHNSKNNLQTICTCQVMNIDEVFCKSVKYSSSDIPVMAKIPVIISYTELQIHIESKIKLDSFATGIRGCYRKIIINNCKLFHTGNYRNGKLHIKGIIRESLEYTESKLIGAECEAGKIRNIIVDIPFECSAKIYYITPPVLKTSDKLIYIDVSKEYQIQNNDSTSLLFSQTYKNLVPTNNSQSLQGLLFELEEAHMVDSHITAETSLSSNLHTFNEITQDTVLNIKFCLLQKKIIKFHGSLIHIQ